MARLSAREREQQLRRSVAFFVAEAGFAKPSSIPEDMTFTAWCEELAAKGMKVDRKPFLLSDRPALRPIYDAIPTTRADAYQRKLVIMKATQLGLTVWEVLADLYMALKWGPVNIGLFLPDQSTAAFKSEQRFMPIVRSHPDLYNRLINRIELDGATKKIGEGNILTRQFADSLLMFLWTSGKVTTESRPMDVVSLDEVQEMMLDQIDKVLARMGDSLVQFALLLSTANQPELDIHYWYLLGTQEVWHTRCGECGVESDLSDPGGIFPGKSTAYNTGQVKRAPKGEFVWTCPACSAYIPDPQVGRYIPQRPENEASGIRSLLLPRTISPRITPRDMVTGWNRAKTGNQRKSFFNRTLARPYIDPDQLPVTLAHLQNAEKIAAELGLKWAKSAQGTYMGVDQMGGWNAIIIKGRLPDGRQQVLHCEAIFGEDCFKATGELMDRYGVTTCVVEQLPNVNDARRFANAFPRRVYLAGYADLRDDMLVWGDDLTKSDKRTAKEDRSRHSVTISQYKMMQTALFRLRDAQCLWPNSMELEQTVLDDKGERRIPIVRDWVWDHFTKTALVIEQNEETRKPRAKVRKVGLDPHFAFANMLCDVAWARDGGSTTFMLPDMPGPNTMEQPGAGRMLDQPGVPPEVRQMAIPAAAGTCGSCIFMKGTDCTGRGMATKAHLPGCFMHAPRPAS